MATYRIVPRSWAKFNAVRLAATDAARQVQAIGSHVPETLTSVALQHTVHHLRYIFLIRFRVIISVVP